MLNTTTDAIRSLLKADPSLSPQDRTRIVAVLKSGGKDSTGSPRVKTPRLLRRDTVAERLGCTIRQVDNLAREGILRRVILPGRTRAAGFRESDVMALITGGAE